MQNDDATHFNMEWENRVLCSDETCIGTIARNGRCTECGKLYEGGLPSAPAAETMEKGAEPLLDPDGSPNEDIEAVAPAAEIETEDDTDPEWESRVLCPDESCIGVIGTDGRCKECGKAIN